MTVTLSVRDYPGMSVITVDLGLGHAPIRTNYEGIVRAFSAIQDVPVDSVGSLRSHEGIYGINRRTDSTVGTFTLEEMARIRRVANDIARHG